MFTYRGQGVTVASAVAAVETTVGTWRTDDSRWEREVQEETSATGRQVRVVHRSAAIPVELVLQADVTAAGELSVALSVTNREADGLRVNAIHPLESREVQVGTGTGPLRFYKNGWQTWSPAYSIGLDEVQDEPQNRKYRMAHTSTPERVRTIEAGAHWTEWMGMLYHPAGREGVLFGYATFERQMGRFELQSDASGQVTALQAVAVWDALPLAIGEQVASEPLVLLCLQAGEAPEAVFARYAERVAAQMQPLRWSHVPNGWCSWYYYFTGVTEADVLQNVQALQQHPEEVRVEYVQIDDGYMADLGDWTDITDKFPSGMKALAQQIRAAGFKPGLWLAPFFAAESSRLYREHPEWVVRDATGQPVVAQHNWNRDCYGLDCTHPEVQAWLRELFRTVVEEWGFEYVKLDFLFGAAVPGRRYDPQATRVSAYRQGLAVIRDTVGERFILGCGSLMGPTVGLVHANRIGADVAPFWFRGEDPCEPAAKMSMLNLFTRSWMHERWWQNDPDCVLLREANSELSEAEVRTIASAVALSGGMLLYSDDMSVLSERRLDVLKQTAPALREAAVPLDLLTSSFPSVYAATGTARGETWQVVQVMNTEDAEQTRVLNRQDVGLETEQAYHVSDFWSGQYMGVWEAGAQWTLPTLPAHGSVVLALRRVRGRAGSAMADAGGANGVSVPADTERPYLVGTNLHISQGDADVLSATCSTERYALQLRAADLSVPLVVHVAVPEGTAWQVNEGWQVTQQTGNVLTCTGTHPALVLTRSGARCGM